MWPIGWLVLFSVFCLSLVTAQKPAEGDYGGFYTWEEVQQKIAGWKREHPDRLQVGVLGKTLEGREIPLLKISDHAEEDEDEPEVLLMAGIHPREQPPLNALMAFVDDLLQDSRPGEPRQSLVESMEIWVIPVLNVDGKIWDMSVPEKNQRGADWRKNRRQNPDGTRGVDLNRNFPVRWGAWREIDPAWKASTSTTRGNIYEGPAPLSEPESAALAAFFADRPLHGFMDIHCPFHEILVPGYTDELETRRYQKITDGMRSRQKEPYPAGKPRSRSEPAPGMRAGDTGLTYTYAYYTRGIWALNFEIGREGKKGVRERYLAPEIIEEEYRNDLKDAWIAFLEACSQLPRAECLAGEVINDVARSDDTLPGTFTWLPGETLRGTFAVLVSRDPQILVTSEFRRFPLKNGFSVQPVGSLISDREYQLDLHVWDVNDNVRRITHRPVVLKCVTTPGKNQK